MNLQKLLDKKKGDGAPLDDNYKGAKMSMLQALHDEMKKMMAGGMQDGVKKVTVAAPDEEGLAHGLDTAKDVLGDAGDNDSDSDSSEDMGDSATGMDGIADHEGEKEVGSDLTPEEIDEMIAHLHNLKMGMGKE